MKQNQATTLFALLHLRRLCFDVLVKFSTLHVSAGFARAFGLASAEYLVHSYNRNNLVGIVFANSAYPTRSAFSIINQVCVQKPRSG